MVRREFYLYIKTMFRSKFTITGVFIALLVISIIQYNWLIQSTERDIEELYKNINFNIYRTISWELESELFNLRTLFGKNFESYNTLNTFIEETESDYLYSMGYIDDGLGQVYIDQKWSIVVEDEIDMGKLHGYFIPVNDGLVKFHFPIRVGGHGLDGFIIFDFQSFYGDKVTSSINNTMEEYEFTWHYSFPEDGKLINLESYRYSPFRVIYERLFLHGEKRVIGLTLFIDPQKNSPRLFMKDRRGDINKQIYIEIQSEGKPLFMQKENVITLQWLITLLLLIGIGLAYILIVNQVKRLKKLREKEKMFVATITHELRTPLTVINSAADNIKTGSVKPERLTTYGDLIKSQSKRLSSMVEGILLFSRFEGKKERAPKLTPLNLQHLKRDLEPLHEDLEISIPIEKPILSDRESLNQILSNLINNAAKHAYKLGESGPIRIKAHIRTPNRVIISVEDDGLGLEREDKKEIFKPFYRAKRSYDEQRKGSGLGLYISWNRAKLLGGELRVESPYEGLDGSKKTGCRFILDLPYKEIDSEKHTDN